VLRQLNLTVPAEVSGAVASASAANSPESRTAPELARGFDCSHQGEKPSSVCFSLVVSSGQLTWNSPAARQHGKRPLLPGCRRRVGLKQSAHSVGGLQLS